MASTSFAAIALRARIRAWMRDDEAAWRNAGDALDAPWPIFLAWRAELCANPGCYPTAAALALIPLARERLIDPASIIINASSGVSGARSEFPLTPSRAGSQELISREKVWHGSTPSGSCSRANGRSARAARLRSFAAPCLELELRPRHETPDRDGPYGRDTRQLTDA